MPPLPLAKWNYKPEMAGVLITILVVALIVMKVTKNGKEFPVLPSIPTGTTKSTTTTPASAGQDSIKTVGKYLLYCILLLVGLRIVILFNRKAKDAYTRGLRIVDEVKKSVMDYLDIGIWAWYAVAVVILVVIILIYPSSALLAKVFVFILTVHVLFHYSGYDNRYGFSMEEMRERMKRGFPKK